MCFLYMTTTTYMEKQVSTSIMLYLTSYNNMRSSPMQRVRICWILGSAAHSSLGQYKAPSSAKCSTGGSLPTKAASCDGTLNTSSTWSMESSRSYPPRRRTTGSGMHQDYLPSCDSNYFDCPLWVGHRLDISWTVCPSPVVRVNQAVKKRKM